MLSKVIVRTQPYGLSLALVMLWTAVALAGGFGISVEAPDAQVKGAVAVVRAFGCHDPSDATMSATAEGIVNGRRQTVPVQLTNVSKGVYAIKQQWPSQGVWVLAISGTYIGHTSSALVGLGPNSQIQTVAGDGKGSVQTVPRKLKAEEIEAALRTMAARNGQSTRAAR